MARNCLCPVRVSSISDGQVYTAPGRQQHGPAGVPRRATPRHGTGRDGTARHGSARRPASRDRAAPSTLTQWAAGPDRTGRPARPLHGTRQPGPAQPSTAQHSAARRRPVWRVRPGRGQSGPWGAAADRRAELRLPRRDCVPCRTAGQSRRQPAEV